MPQRLVGDHEAADVLRQVPRAAAQHVRDRQHACDKWVFHVETRFAQTLFHRRFAVAPAVTLRKQRDLVGRKAEGLGDVAHRALAAVDRKSTRLNPSHYGAFRLPSSACKNKHLTSTPYQLL